jgi:aerobic-type carbon monoxide dehydrogenase small subunit (CoxS/CutS family)
MLMAAHALIKRKGGPVERDEVIEALSGHICRCTGYAKIVDSVIAASRGDTAALGTTREIEGAVA